MALVPACAYCSRSSFLRNNGLPIFVVMAILLIFSYRTYFKRLLITLGVVAIAYFVVTGPIFNLMDVKPANPNETLSIPTQQMAKVIKEDGHLTQDQKQYLGEIMPLPVWKEKYDPYITDPIKFSGPYNSEVIFEDFPFYLSTWAAILKENFSLYVEAYLDQTSLVWQINQPDDGYTNTFSRRVHNELGLKQNPISQSIHEAL